MEKPANMIDWLYGLQHFGIKLGLDNIRELLRMLDRPERSYASVLVAGTNGKGSVAAMLSSMLESGGVKTGLFTSPHLVRPHERIRIGGEEISDAELQRLLGAMRDRIEAARERGGLEAHPSFFEVITASALEAFRERNVRAAMLEVGLGGRLDATNAVEADLSIVVSIDLDHVKSLGPTIEHIAAEKAEIVKPDRPLVSGVVRPEAKAVLQEMCRRRNAEWIDARDAVGLTHQKYGAFTLHGRSGSYPDLRVGLAGQHQVDNARIAFAALERIAQRLGIETDAAAVRRGLAGVRWPGRLQWIPGHDDGTPDLLLDGAHNPAGAATLADYLDGLGRPAPVVLYGAMQGKLIPDMIRPLAGRVHGMVVTRPGVRRSAEPDEVASLAREVLDGVEVVEAPEEALERARSLAGPDRYVLVTGSLYLVGEVLRLLEGRAAPGPVSM